MTILLLLFAWLSPWVLGTAISLACLKRRYGFHCFALGCGYLSGLFILTMVIKLHDYYQQPVNIYAILLGCWIPALPLLLFVRARPCSIEELRLEKAPSNTAYLLSLLLMLLMLARLFLQAWYLPRPTAGVAESLPVLHDVFAFGDKWFIHFADVQQLLSFYTQTAVSGVPVDAVWLHLPWQGMVLASALLVFGGLRYLGARLLPATAATYLLLSLPFLNDYLQTAQPLLLWLSANYLLVMLLTLMLITFAEGRLPILLLIAVAAVSVSQYLLVLSVISFIVLLLGHRLGKGGGLLITAVSVLLVGGSFWLMPEVGQQLQAVAGQTQARLPLSQQTLQKLSETLYEAIFLRDDWHLLLLTTIVSMLIIFVGKVRHDYPGLQSVVIAVWVALLGWLALLLRGQFIDSAQFSVYFRETLLYFAPILCLFPACVAHLINRNDDSLPTI